jgi:amidohydrolase
MDRLGISGPGTFVAVGLMLLIASVQSFAKEVGEIVEGELPALLETYKQLHAAPELSYFEEKTSERVAGALEAAGYEVTRPVGRYEGSDRPCYGVVAVLKNGKGPTVLVRTDLDALPVEEKTGAAYASRVRMKDVGGEDVPVMHACGHDMHMTVLIGTAQALAALKSRWKGTLILIGQPAEERGGGARAMLNGGLYERWPAPDYALAEHVDPTLEAGAVGFCPGWAMANVDMIDILIRGVGAHGAQPHKGRDPIVLAAQVINALQTVVSREIDPVETGVVTVGSIHGGTKHNIIPDEVRLQLTVRSFKDEVRKTMLAAIERITVNTARAAGVPEDRLPVISKSDEYTPALYNSPELTASTEKALAAALGGKNVVTIPPTTGGEDFSEYGRTARKVPVCLFRLGTAEPGSDPAARPGIHSPYFLPVAEPTIRTGVTAMTFAVLNLMGK